MTNCLIELPLVGIDVHEGPIGALAKRVQGEEALPDGDSFSAGRKPGQAVQNRDRDFVEPTPLAR